MEFSCLKNYKKIVSNIIFRILDLSFPLHIFLEITNILHLPLLLRIFFAGFSVSVRLTICQSCSFFTIYLICVQLHPNGFETLAVVVLMALMRPCIMVACDKKLAKA